MFRLRKDLNFIKKNLIIFLILLGVLVALGTTAIFSLTNVSFAGDLADIKSKILPGEESIAEIKLEGEKVILKLFVADQDKMKAQQFFERMGSDLTQDLVIGIDSQSARKLSGLLPIKVNVFFDEQKLSFGNRSFGLLNSSLPSNRYEFATDSSKLIWQSNSEKDFKLEVSDPKSLLLYATASGKLHMSNIINPSVFDLLERVDTINLRVNGKNVEGFIKLN